MLRNARYALLTVLVATLGNAAGKDMTCATCHSQEATHQPLTPMAKALQVPGKNPLFQRYPNLRFQGERFAYEIATRDDQTTYTVTDGTGRIVLPIRWAFGKDAQTFVFERDGQYFESLVSYYPEIGKLDVTLGDGVLQPKTLDEAIGRRVEMTEITACFNCHSSHSANNGKLDTRALVPGLTCDRCHTDTSEHMASFAHGGGTPRVPEQLGKKSAESMSNFCGQCHRSWQTVVRNDWTGEMDVRFQPYRLANSKCFDGADTRISCVACHNPHENLAKQASSYDARCTACHSAAAVIRPVSTAPAPVMAKACPVAKSNCVTCHMPKVRLPGGHQTFTDHQIRIVKAGEVYPN